MQIGELFDAGDDCGIYPSQAAKHTRLGTPSQGGVYMVYESGEDYPMINDSDLLSERTGKC